MDLVNKYDQMALSLKVNGKIIKPMAKGNFNIKMVLFMKDNEKIIKQMVMEYLCSKKKKMEKLLQCMRGSGKMIINMALELKHGQTDLNMKGSILTDKNMGKEFICEMMAPNMMVIGIRIKLLDM